MKDNLVIGVLGERESGKSKTWNELFNPGKNGTVKTGEKLRKLYLNDKECIEVFLINGSPEERKKNIKTIIGAIKPKPRIVLCSMQYIENVNGTINFFDDNGYFLYMQWLNPGYRDENDTVYADRLGIVNRVLFSLNSTLSIRNGNESFLKARVQEIKDYLYGWASSRKLIEPCE